MSNYERKRGSDEPAGDGHSGYVRCVDNFVFEVSQRFSEIDLRNHSCVALADQDGDYFSRTDIQDVNSLRGYRIEDRIDPRRSRLRDVPLRQRAGVQVEGIRHFYSSRISIIPRLNWLSLGSSPSLIASSCSFLAPIGLPRIPSCFMNLSQPATKSASSSLLTRKSSSASSRSSRSASDIGSLCCGGRLPRRFFPGLDRVAIVRSLVRSGLSLPSGSI